MAVIEGISATARVITSAALIMICVFGSFMLGDEPTIKMFGLGPGRGGVHRRHGRAHRPGAGHHASSSATGTGGCPGWLDRLLPNLDVEGGVGLPEPEYEPVDDGEDSGAWAPDPLPV